MWNQNSKENKTLREIYDLYRDEMARTLAVEEVSPEKLDDPAFVDEFVTQVDRLDTLIALYADLLAQTRS